MSGSSPPVREREAIDVLITRFDPPGLPGCFMLVGSIAGHRYRGFQRIHMRRHVTRKGRKLFAASEVEVFNRILKMEGVIAVHVTCKGISIRCDMLACDSEEQLRRLLHGLLCETVS